MSHSRYETILPIGTGGMATVYVGRKRGAEGFSRLVALKKAHPHVRTDEALVENMKLEARLASRLHHSNVVSVLDVEEDDDGDLVLVLDYVEGCTLRTLLSKVEKLGEQRPREIIRVILDIAAGLHAAHQATDENGILLGLVHRDVSPSNVLVGVDGVARLSDFGIAKAIFEGSDRTETGILKGKTSYMAPEYVMHQHASSASDLFSLAVMAWESLADARLFKGATEIDTLRRVASAQIRPLADERPELAALDPVLAKALSRLPSDRHASVEEFALDLENMARSIDLVSSHNEVASLVERAIRNELEERRRSLRSDDAETVVGQVILPIETAAASSGPRSGLGGRDDVATASLIKSEAVVSVPVSAPMPVSVRESKLTSQHQPAAIAHPHPPASIRHQPVAGAKHKLGLGLGGTTPSHGAAALSASQIAMAERQRKSRSTERLALVAAFALLLLALGAMAMQLRTNAEDNSGAVAAPVQLPVTSPPATTSSSSSNSAAEDGSTTANSAPGSASAGQPSSPPPTTHFGKHRTPLNPASTTSGLVPKKAPPNPYPNTSAH